MAIHTTLYDPSKHSCYLPAFVSILNRCILESNTIATFLPPLGEEVTKWWEKQLSEASIADSKRTIIMAFDPAGEEGPEGNLVGYAMLNDISTQTGPFRCSVEKLMVDPNVRRKGVGRLLMEKLDDVAWAKGLWLLVSTAVLISMFHEAHKLSAARHGDRKSGRVVLPRVGLRIRASSLACRIDQGG
jgi:GNAT superfamily N-acetyltransferase